MRQLWRNWDLSAVWRERIHSASFVVGLTLAIDENPADDAKSIGGTNSSCEPCVRHQAGNESRDRHY